VLVLSIECFAVTHIGNFRKNSEDNFFIGEFLSKEEQLSISQTKNQSLSKSILTDEAENRVYAVSDGMGGHEFGEDASNIVVSTLGKFVANHKAKRCSRRKDKYAFIQAFQESVSMANQEINDFAANKSVNDNMGATLSGVILFSDEVVPFNIGDSSVFSIEGNNLCKHTVDDNEATLFNNNISKDDRLDGKRLTKYFGLPKTYGTLTATISQPIPIKTGQMFLIATDGLTDSLSQDMIADIIQNNSDCIENTVNALLREALNIENGGKDNITIVMLKIGSNSRRKGV